MNYGEFEKKNKFTLKPGSMITSNDVGDCFLWFLEAYDISKFRAYLSPGNVEARTCADGIQVFLLFSLEIDI